MLVEKYAVYIESVVRPFCTIHDGPAFNGNATAVGFYLRICFYYSGKHIEMYFYYISFFPFAGDTEIAVVHVAFYCLSVDGYPVNRFLIVSVSVQVTGQYISTYPTGNTELHRKVLIALRYFQTDVSLPWVIGFLFQNNLFLIHFQLGLVREEEVHVYLIVLHGIHISR